MDPDLKLALGAAAIVAVVEVPLSKRYPTVPATTTGQRMLAAGGMAFVGALVAAKVLR
jgi:hypothetical protein